VEWIFFGGLTSDRVSIRMLGHAATAALWPDV
jgi:hypothetical protein